MSAEQNHPKFIDDSTSDSSCSSEPLSPGKETFTPHMSAEENHPKYIDDSTSDSSCSSEALSPGKETFTPPVDVKSPLVSPTSLIKQEPIDQENNQEQSEQNNFELYHRALCLKTIRFKEMKLSLNNHGIWKEFSPLGTEMIITKLGRRMFPIVKVAISNLDPDAFYFVMMDIVPLNDHRHRFIGQKWVVNGSFGPSHLSHPYIHPSSPAPGHVWMQEPIGFYKVKLTNSESTDVGHFLLTSMRKYVVRIHVAQGSDVSLLHWCPYNTFPLWDTAFIAVTAYQNSKMVELKVQRNPFAKSFATPLRQKRSSKKANNDSSSPNNDKKRKKTDPLFEAENAHPRLENSSDIKSQLPTIPFIPYDVPLTVQTDFSNKGLYDYTRFCPSNSFAHSTPQESLAPSPWGYPTHTLTHPYFSPALMLRPPYPLTSYYGLAPGAPMTSLYDTRLCPVPYLNRPELPSLLMPIGGSTSSSSSPWGRNC